MNRRSFIGSLAGVACALSIPKQEAKAVIASPHPIISPEDYPVKGKVFAIGESWCRRTESINEELSVKAVDAWFKIRLQQLGLGVRIYTFHAYPENKFRKGTPAEQEEMARLDEELEKIEDDNDWGWTTTSPFKEATREDIVRWFRRRELSLCAEESAIGVSPISDRAWMLYGWQAHWEANHHEEAISKAMQGW